MVLSSIPSLVRIPSNTFPLQYKDLVRVSTNVRKTICQPIKVMKHVTQDSNNQTGVNKILTFYLRDTLNKWKRLNWIMICTELHDVLDYAWIGFYLFLNALCVKSLEMTLLSTGTMVYKQSELKLLLSLAEEHLPGRVVSPSQGL